MSTIWPQTAVPGATDADTLAEEFGVKFTTSGPGQIGAIRFYKATQNTGIHTGSLWTATGTLLGRAAFTAETASGWQQTPLIPPVEIQPGATYVASVHMPNGRYSYTAQGLAAAVSNPPLTALARGSLWVTSSTPRFPTNVPRDYRNYWIDVNFTATAGTPPGVPANLTAVMTAVAEAVWQWWNDPGSTGTPTGYIVEYQPPNAAWVEVARVSGSVSGQTIPNLLIGTYYNFRVTPLGVTLSAPLPVVRAAVLPTGMVDVED